MQSCSLLSVATAVPQYVISQADSQLLAREAFGGKKALFDRLSTVFDNAGIARRHIVQPSDWYVQDHGWHDLRRAHCKPCVRLRFRVRARAEGHIRPVGGETPRQWLGVVGAGIASPSNWRTATAMAPGT